MQPTDDKVSNKMPGFKKTEPLNKDQADLLEEKERHGIKIFNIAARTRGSAPKRKSSKPTNANNVPGLVTCTGTEDDEDVGVVITSFDDSQRNLRSTPAFGSPQFVYNDNSQMYSTPYTNGKRTQRRNSFGESDDQEQRHQRFNQLGANGTPMSSGSERHRSFYMPMDRTNKANQHPNSQLRSPQFQHGDGPTYLATEAEIEMYQNRIAENYRRQQQKFDSDDVDRSVSPDMLNNQIRFNGGNITPGNHGERRSRNPQEPVPLVRPKDKMGMMEYPPEFSSPNNMPSRYLHHNDPRMDGLHGISSPYMVPPYIFPPGDRTQQMPEYPQRMPHLAHYPPHHGVPQHLYPHMYPTQMPPGDPRFMDPRFMDPRLMDPRYIDPKFVDPRMIDPRSMGQVPMDPKTSKSKATKLPDDSFLSNYMAQYPKHPNSAPDHNLIRVTNDDAFARSERSRNSQSGSDPYDHFGNNEPEGSDPFGRSERSRNSQRSGSNSGSGKGQRRQSALGSNREKTLQEQIEELSEINFECYKSLKNRWEDSRPKFDFPNEMYLRFLRQTVDRETGEFCEELAWKQMRNFDKRYLKLNVSKMKKQLLTKTLFPIKGLKTKLGHDVFYMKFSRHVPKKTRTQKIIDNLAYVVNCMLEKESASKDGIGFVACMDDWGMKHFEMKYWYKFMMALQGSVVPVRVQLFLIVNPPSWFGTVLTAMKPMLSPAFRKKVKTIKEEKLSTYLQNGYQEFLPDDMKSGRADTEAIVKEFINDRKQIERKRAITPASIEEERAGFDEEEEEEEEDNHDDGEFDSDIEQDDEFEEDDMDEKLRPDLFSLTRLPTENLYADGVGYSGIETIEPGEETKHDPLGLQQGILSILNQNDAITDSAGPYDYMNYVR